MSPSRRIHSPAFKVKLVEEALALPAACRIKPTCRKYPGVEPTQLRKWIKALDKLQAQAREESWKTAMLGSITTEAPASDLHSFQKLLESEPALGPVPATAFWQPALRACEEGEGGSACDLPGEEFEFLGAADVAAVLVGTIWEQPALLMQPMAAR
ncbi:hypothetical protein EMIHUDRAFT_350484 [Emiliania huxleyi CCMP1516]|uniref:Uncharacterized protein n=2 Tax=Emiliania huxleyi TaxID=2903 RepID=A0A0D3IUL8_EMIH1|nr:hypothetical protein EMIHUDRAFT_350484 [Emiliania huxleyi CCMP1516]EOD14953.1 hypothetical protein EMIHUDRAFT_350484 [Emiliania huxleyi CCMP1516]|eukprot:XP_005767382.1 hypothetical protein EMIHUDRAFT_350484 [Emiliania huxleyi CCMP1516]